jgi:hypothetical protein
MSRETFLGGTLALMLFAGQQSSVSWAQEANPPYPAGSDIVFQWTYSCDENAKGCSFNCPAIGASNVPAVGGASNVTKLTIYLGSVRLESDKTSSAIFYEFSTKQIPRGSGFTINSGLNSLACRVTGMTLDYSGPPRSYQAKFPS